MSGVAALVNPAVAGQKSISLYYTTVSKQLAISMRSGTDEETNPKEFAANVNDYAGILQIPCEIASDVYRGLSVVAAATLPKGEAGDSTNNISLVSPVYRVFATTTKNSINVSMCSTGQQAYMYYLNGPAEAKMSIKECTLDGTVMTVSKNDDALVGSSLAAWYEPTTKERLVIYQLYDTLHLKELSVVKGQSVIIENALQCRKGTSVAVSYFENKVYLYYVDTNYVVRRIVRDPGTGWDGSSAQKVKGAPLTIRGNTQITVTAANRINHLFYASQDDSDGAITHVHDRIDDINPGLQEPEDGEVGHQEHGHEHHHHHHHHPAAAE
jgi:hypothetical protein